MLVEVQEFEDVLAHGDVVAHWYSAPDFWGRGPGFESGISHNYPYALQDHCVIK